MQVGRSGCAMIVLWGAAGCVTWTSAHPPSAALSAPPAVRPRASVVIRKPAINGWRFDPGALVLKSLNAVGEFPLATGKVESPNDRRLEVEILERPLSRAADVWSNVDAILLFLLPAVRTEGFDLHFRLQGRGRAAKTYQYTVLQRGVLWLPLLPFAWISLLTPSSEDAFQSTVARFVADSRGDGFW